jgi:outer membrane protein OmpA-like peptidoglycan-associated protein
MDGSNFRRSRRRGGALHAATPAFLFAFAFALLPMLDPTPARAAVWLTPYAGYSWWDDNLRLQDKMTYGGKLGVFFGKLGVEGNFGFTPGEFDTVAPPGVASDVHIYNYSGDLVLRFTGSESKVIPYVLGGVGVTDFQYGASFGDTSRVSYDAGAGILFKLSPGFGLRFEGRDLMFKLASPFNDNLRNTIIATGGISIGFGTKKKDSDKDGVPDKDDRCPDTPLGCRVDAEGCPIDSDKDGVCDGIDQCPDTPAGATVDAHGCPTDSDHDGVWDGIDRCPDTPQGVPVDETGCPKDSDGDGVPDYKDKCPNTPPGMAVDEDGCPHDSDGDGVPDDKDLCPNTPAGAKVDKDGCPIEITQQETEMLDKGSITVRNIHFETAKWDILPTDEEVLNTLGKIFIQWPQLRIEIGGHCDSRGGVAYNQQLSEHRANAVKDWLLAHYSQLTPVEYTAVGYGKSRPVATNKTAAGMALNRRVEFKVMNPEELTKYKERRQLLQK